jgi:5-methylcytosine-specific restriction protein A
MNNHRITGKELSKIWNLNVKHALYREDGKWYHHLRRFPGALCDKCGFIIFENENDYFNCQHLQHGQDLHVPSGIELIPGYKKFNQSI